jgi:hypothetical protein
MSMRDFVLITKIGKSPGVSEASQPRKVGEGTKSNNLVGDGAYSTVFKVKRLSDNQVYALKKVTAKYSLIEQ